MPHTLHQAAKPASLTCRHISAEHLKLALVARRGDRSRRWAAMSDGAWTTRTCHRRPSDFDTLHRVPPLLAPMERGELHQAITRQRITRGLPTIRKTFGVGLKQLLAEPKHLVPAGVQA